MFNTLLQQLGYNSYIISARVFDNKKNDFGEEYDHLTIIVEINQTEYLVDVRFEEFTFYPLYLEIGHIQSDLRGNFVIEEDENGYFNVSKIEGETICFEYIFTKKKRTLKEFSKMCNYPQTSPNSHFTKKII